MAERARDAWSGPVVVSAYARGSRPEPGRESMLPRAQVEEMLAELRQVVEQKAAVRQLRSRRVTGR